MNFMKKTFILLTVLLILLAAACENPDKSGSAGNSNSPENPDDSGDLNSAGDPAGKSLYEDDLPEMDFKGGPFKILHFPAFTNAHGYLWTAEETGDVINDAIYKANSNTAARFNLSFEENICPAFGDVPGLLKKSTAAGDNAYDYLMMADRDAFALAMEGKYFHTVDELPHVNLDKAYWDQSLRKAASIGNKLYFAYGANMLSVYDFSAVMLFNKKIVEDLTLGNIYALVKDGKWTIDKMTEMAKTATADINGDGVMGADDRYGIPSRGDYFYASFWVCDRIPLVAKDQNDALHFNIPGNEKLFGIFAKLHEISTSGYIWETTGGTDPAMEMFSKGNALFFSSTTYTTLRLRGMEIDYGIIPYPTLEEKKPGEPYSARAMSGFPVLIPAASDPVRGSAVIESLACEYQKNVIPAYYDNAVQIKATRDEESIEMIDMLLTNKYLDLGDTLWAIDLRNEYVGLFTSKKGDTVQSFTEKITPKFEETLQKAMKDFQTAGE